VALFKLIKLFESGLQELEQTKPKTMLYKWYIDFRIKNTKKRIAVLRNELATRKNYSHPYK
jgi:hypothetical protein